MSTDGALDDFQAFLDSNFSVSQFANDLTKAINNNLDTNELDIYTPLKKINYDISEIDSRTDKLIRDHPLEILEQLDKRSTTKDTVGATLKPSLDYLSMSFERLNMEVLKPYLHALKLQAALGKMHQTSSLLRDALVYIHLASQIEELSGDMEDESKLSRLTTLYSQLTIHLEQNVNLKSLNLIKKYETEVFKEKRLQLVNHLSHALIKKCTTNRKLGHALDSIKTLALNLYRLSSKEYTVALDKIALFKIQSAYQILSKTIVSVRSLNTAMDDATTHGYALHELETMLQSVSVGDTNLLQEYLKGKKYDSITANYWRKTSGNFQKDFEVSYRRGGPVGKSLLSNSKFIKDTIVEYMPRCGEGYDDYLQIMLESISILNTEKK